MGARVLLVAGAALLGACSLFTSLDDLSGKAPEVVYVPVDGGSSGPDGSASSGGLPFDASFDVNGFGMSDLYRTAVVSDGPKAYFRFEETAGTTAKDEMAHYPRAARRSRSSSERNTPRSRTTRGS